MNRKLKYGLAVYLFGAAVMEAQMIFYAISNGGIARLAGKGAVDILITAALHLAFSLLLAAAGDRRSPSIPRCASCTVSDLIPPSAKFQTKTLPTFGKC